MTAYSLWVLNFAAGSESRSRTRTSFASETTSEQTRFVSHEHATASRCPSSGWHSGSHRAHVLPKGE